jgi:hypothetical protein
MPLLLKLYAPLLLLCAPLLSLEVACSTLPPWPSAPQPPANDFVSWRFVKAERVHLMPLLTATFTQGL